MVNPNLVFPYMHHRDNGTVVYAGIFPVNDDTYTVVAVSSCHPRPHYSTGHDLASAIRAAEVDARDWLHPDAKLTGGGMVIPA